MRKSKPDMNKEKYSFVSIFSGCGGLDLGFVKSGFVCVGSYDIDNLAVNVHNVNMPDCVSIVQDLTDSSKDYFIPHADLLIAGPPCQGFSTAGKMQEDDPRNDLLQVVVRIAQRVNPRVIIVENVTGLRSQKMRHHQELLVENLKQSGFETHCMVVDASNYGVPQRRKRVFIIAWNPIYRFDNNFDLTDYKSTKTVKETLVDISPFTANHNPKVFQDGTKELVIAECIHAGQKLCDVRGGSNAVHTWEIPEAFGKTTSLQKEVLFTVQNLRRRERVRKHGDSDPVSIRRISEMLGVDVRPSVEHLLKKGYLRKIGFGIDLAYSFNGWYRRLDGEGFSPTVDSYFGRPKYFLHPFENRGLTVREAARIQTFPDSFVFSGSESEQYRMIGNAVPPKLAEVVADRIRRNLAVGV
jgi:DNA (cytosine-5)-methyltransferase 1